MRTLDDLAAYLRRLRGWAGHPSFTQLVARINAGRAYGPAGRTTVYDCFRSGRKRVDADLVSEIAAALGLDGPGLARLRQAVRAVHESVEAAAVVDVRAALPAPSARFTGRARELAQVARRLRDAAGRHEPPVVVITGPAGVGKTELALAVADRVRGRGQYSDVALFVDLRGFDAGRPPCAPEAVLAGLLKQLGVTDERIYSRRTIAQKAELFRRTLAGRPAIVLLDNAASVDQVRWLLPGGRQCLVVVTSRRRLRGLPPEGVVSLAALSAADARDLLRRYDHWGRADAEPEAAARLAEQLCFGMPLDLMALGARLADPEQGSWSLADHVARLERFPADDISRPALAGSYHALPVAAQRVFRLLTVHPGGDFTGYDAAALADLGWDEADWALRELADCHLLLQRLAGRFQFHDAVSAYACRLRDRQDPASAQRAALARLLHQHRYLTSLATVHYAPGGREPPPATARPATPVPTITDPAGALAWLDAERTNLLAGARHAAHHGLPGHASHMSATLGRYLDAGGYWYEAAVLHRDASRATEPAARGQALTSLAGSYWRLGRYDRSVRRCRQALRIFRELGDRSRESRALNALGLVELRRGHHDEALRHHQRALVLAREAQDRYEEATALNNLGVVHTRLGHYHEALDRYPTGPGSVPRPGQPGARRQCAEQPRRRVPADRAERGGAPLRRAGTRAAPGDRQPVRAAVLTGSHRTGAPGDAAARGGDRIPPAGDRPRPRPRRPVRRV